MYKLRISSQGKKELKKLPINHKKAILEALLEIKIDPLLGKPLKRELKGRFSYRVGVYRVIYKIRKKDRIVEVITVGHREKIYN